MPAEEQCEILGEYIIDEVDGEPSQSEGVGDCAVRLLQKYRKAIGDARDLLTVCIVVDEMQLAQPDLSTMLAAAREVLESALGKEGN